MNVLAWTLSQFQGEQIQAYSTTALLGAYDWERYYAGAAEVQNLLEL